MKIAIANDHAAVEMKIFIRDYLKDLGYELIDLGTNSGESCDYPVYARKLGETVACGEADLGIGICGTGLGMSIAAGKVRGIRAACCSDPFSARMARAHNNANVLCFGARVVGEELARMIVDEWLGAEFLGGKHLRRVDMISEIELSQGTSDPA